MKKILTALFLLTAIATHAQLNNSWIDYSKTYYKFKVGADGVNRINQATLAAAGLAGTPAEQFQLWRNGEQVRIFTSVASGQLSTTDYIEFWGKLNDGKKDRGLYIKAGYQLSDAYSLFSDTSTYFLTVNQNTSANLRFTNATNDVAGNSLPADNYFLRTIKKTYRDQMNRGYAVSVGEYVYSSSYDLGEGWTSYDAAPCCNLFYQFTGLNVYGGAPANSVSFYVSAFGNALNTRNFKVKFFSNQILEQPMNFFDTVKTTLGNLPNNLLQSPDYLLVDMNGNSTVATDRVVVAELALTYPSKFNFNNQKNFEFDLQPSPAGNFLVIDNFNSGAATPVLYGLSDGTRYVGDISIAGKVRFALPAAVNSRKFILVNQEAANLTAVNTLITKNFVNYAVAANQGDYIIISNPKLYNDGNGVNYVDQYKQYRASANGGSFNTTIVSIDELTDQFAFGIKKHPASIRDFIRFANQRFAIQPKYIFLIGRGINAMEYRVNENDPIVEQIDLVPTFGWPASDVLLACEQGTNVPLTPVGRLAAINGTEIKHYLNKVIEYEQNQVRASQCGSNRAWMKNIIHVVGGADSLENAQFLGYMNGYKAIVEDTLLGARVETFVKTSTAAVEQANGERIEQLINEGASELSYFGHSSANTLAFNLTSPELYNNTGKYPFFNISGCSAGNFFTFDPQRPSSSLSISEKWIMAENKGAIGFLASTHLGIPPFLNFYNAQFVNNYGRAMYGNTVGNQIKKVLQTLGSNPAALDFYTRIHLEEINLHGDPAIRVNSFPKPDYAIEEASVKISPSIITVAETSFNVNVKIINLGRAISDSIRITIKRRLANDSVQTIYNQLWPATLYSDSLSIDIPINPLTDKGQNKITVSIDADNRIDEICETNNTIVKDVFILEDEVRPVSPYNYSIVNTQNITYSTSTANPLGVFRQYLMEIDTTALFNSPYKKQYTANGVGGLIQYTPTDITFTDSTVYYWRTSMVPINGSLPVWNSFSFVYLSAGGPGYNMSHYYQHLKSTYSSNIRLDNDRQFRFKEVQRDLQIKTGLYPYTGYDRISMTIDFTQYDYYGCNYHVLQFYVFDSATLEPWVNYNTAGSGRFGSRPVCSTPTRNFFEFIYQDTGYRRKAMDFIDALPTGVYVSVTNFGYTTNTTFIDTWKADQARLGVGNSLYHKLKSVGFSEIDSFYKNRPFVFVFRKNDPNFTPRQFMGVTEADQLNTNIVLPSRFKSGSIESPLLGPARSWKTLHWRGKSIEAVSHDDIKIEVYGVKPNGTKDLLSTIQPSIDTSLAFINAATYPFIKLKMLGNDEIYATPNQLQYWRINADYLPEGSVAPNVVFRMKDTVEQGETINFALAFKNVSMANFDSLKVKFVITDRNNVPHTIILPKQKALLTGDTLLINYNIDTRNYPGANTLYVMVNPDNDQPEQYLFNNFIFKDFFVNTDKVNPLMDVTFDGIHILNRDIVAGKPRILIKLKDESRFNALADTSVIRSVKVRFPDASIHTYYFGDSMTFIPANLATGNNTASIELLGNFPQDGEYEFTASGRDAVGNKAGNMEYRVTFNVINQAMISNLLNYPNPFTTSTAFVFTLTGTEIPQNMRIQILTITGKIVKEITRNEIGDLHIGRNITEYKWDGTDTYGQKLANGVYLYRVITNLNGKSLDKYKASGDNTDKYFKGGYGKMYLMR